MWRHRTWVEWFFFTVLGWGGGDAQLLMIFSGFVTITRTRRGTRGGSYSQLFHLLHAHRHAAGLLGNEPARWQGEANAQRDLVVKNTAKGQQRRQRKRPRARSLVRIEKEVKKKKLLKHRALRRNSLNLVEKGEKSSKVHQVVKRTQVEWDSY